MFEYVQEREMGSRQEPRTLFYVITAGEILRDDPGKLSEKGQNQIFELANSRLIAGVSKIYSSSTSNGIETAKILARELDTRMEKKKCLDAFNLGISWTDEKQLREILPSIWNDEEFSAPKGESISKARERFGECMNDIGRRHPDDSVAVVGHTILSCLFYNLVTAAPLDINEWLMTGFASCATYEYAKTGWTLVMSPDNSFLSDPTSVSDWLPENLFG